MLFVTLFLVSWAAQLLFEWQVFVDEQRDTTRGRSSSESPDGDERVEAKLDALLEKQGLDPKDVERSLPEKYRKTR